VSIIGEKEQYATKEEIVEYLRNHIKELEEELKILRTLLAKLEPSAVEEEFDPSERVEEIRISRKTVAKLGIGEDYIRVILKFPTTLPDDIKTYLESTIEEINNRQALEGVSPDERAYLEVKRGPDKTVREIRIRNLYTPLEGVKAKAALKYSVELLYKISKKKG